MRSSFSQSAELGVLSVRGSRGRSWPPIICNGWQPDGKII